MKTNTKNVALDVVSTLIPYKEGSGILAELERVYNIQGNHHNNYGDSEFSMANAETDDDIDNYLQFKQNKIDSATS